MADNRFRQSDLLHATLSVEVDETRSCLIGFWHSYSFGLLDPVSKSISLVGCMYVGIYACRQAGRQAGRPVGGWVGRSVGRSVGR